MASVTKRLRVGQKVSVTDLECGCALAVVPDEQPGLTVTENNGDFLTLDDPVAEVRTRVPCYLVKQISGLSDLPEMQPEEVPAPEAVVPDAMVVAPEVVVEPPVVHQEVMPEAMPMAPMVEAEPEPELVPQAA